MLFRIEPGLKGISGGRRCERSRHGKTTFSVKGKDHGGIVPPHDPQVNLKGKSIPAQFRFAEPTRRERV